MTAKRSLRIRARAKRNGTEGRTLDWLPAALFVVGLSLLWEVSVRMEWLSPLFFPAPSTTFRTLIDSVASGEMATDLRATLTRLLAGILVGGGIGMLTGLMMGWSQRMRTLIDPLVAATHPIPKISILPLVLIIFGIGESSKIVLVAIATFFPMLINTMTGVRGIPPVYFEVAANYKAPPLTVLRRIVIPGSLPMILAGARIALNTALVITIAVELLTAREGLGAAIWLAWETLRTEELYAALVVIAVLGIAFNSLLRFVSRRMAPWESEQVST